MRTAEAAINRQLAPPGPFTELATILFSRLSRQRCLHDGNNIVLFLF